jgi:hypothetical protein
MAMFPISIWRARSITYAACWTDAVVFWWHWDLRESMKEADIEMILERAKQKYPGSAGNSGQCGVAKVVFLATEAYCFLQRAESKTSL